MPIICTRTHRAELTDGATIQTYLNITRSAPRCTYENEDHCFFDFSNPARMIRKRGDEIVAYLDTRPDPVHGFPNTELATNATCYKRSHVCASDGSFWLLDCDNVTWTKISIQNGNDFETSSNSPHDMMCGVTGFDNKLGLVKFLPSRENCEKVIVCQYTLTTVESWYINPETVKPSCSSSTAETTIDSLTSAIDKVHVSAEPESFTPCKICLSEDIAIRRAAIIPCGHVVCTDCIEKVLAHSNRCPFCRGSVCKLLRLFE